MFDIAFTDEPPERLEEGGQGLLGRLRLGAESEGFLAPLALWQRADYERQWAEAAERLLGGASTTAFVTVAWHTWWPMWREGDRVRVHEQLLLVQPIGRVVPLSDVHRTPYELIAAHPVDLSDGHRVSCWEVSVADIAAFATRHGARAASERSAAPDGQST
jgi:hypothetical protein